MFSFHYFAATYFARTYFPEGVGFVPPTPPVVVTGGARGGAAYAGKPLTIVVQAYDDRAEKEDEALAMLLALMDSNL